MRLTIIRALLIINLFLICFYALGYGLEASALISFIVCYIFEPVIMEKLGPRAA